MTAPIPTPSMIRAEEPLEPTAERIRLMRHGLINMIGPVISGVVGIILVPLMFKSLGAELYGLWVIVITLVDRCGAFGDLGVSWSVMREIAGSSSESAEPLVKAVANLYLLLAIAGAVIITAAGLPIGRFMGVTHQTGQILPSVFIFAAAGFVLGQMFSFQIVVLQGLRRFDLSNLLSICSSLLSAGVIVIALALRGGLLGVVQAQAASSAICALGAYRVVAYIQPRFRLRLGRLDWASLRPQMRFSLGNQLVSLLSGVTWESAPLLIGFMLGPAG